MNHWITYAITADADKNPVIHQVILTDKGAWKQIYGEVRTTRIPLALGRRLVESADKFGPVDTDISLED